MVYLAEETCHGHRLVAIKKMRRLGLGTPELVSAQRLFQQEAALLNRLSHPAIPYLYTAFLIEESWHLVIEWIDGATLGSRLNSGQRFTLEAILSLGKDVCDILGYLHSCQPPIIFRDLNPFNVMLTQDDQIKLIDFGIAREYHPGCNRHPHDYGTSGYAPPELYPDAHGMSSFSPQSDIYSLGAVLYQLLSGDDPQNQQTRIAFAPLGKKASPSGYHRFVALVQQMLERDPARRPASIAEVESVLEQAQRGIHTAR
jgi:serine/threonine protein kinase